MRGKEILRERRVPRKHFVRGKNLSSRWGIGVKLSRSCVAMKVVTYSAVSGKFSTLISHLDWVFGDRWAFWSVSLRFFGFKIVVNACDCNFYTLGVGRVCLMRSVGTEKLIRTNSSSLIDGQHTGLQIPHIFYAPHTPQFFNFAYKSFLFLQIHQNSSKFSKSIILQKYSIFLSNNCFISTLTVLLLLV